MSQQLTREEQERKYPEYTWDLTTILKSDEAFEEAFKSIEAKIGEEKKTKGHLGESAETLYEALSLEDELGTKLEKVYVYAHLKQDQDTANDKYTGLEGVHINLLLNIACMEFLVPEILQLDEATIQSFIDSNDDLKRYEFDLKLINEKRPHILDANTEKLLTEAQDALSTPSNVYGMFSKCRFRI